jgi:hypothetical protein
MSSAPAASNPKNDWERILQEVRPRIDPQRFQNWFGPTRLAESSNGKMIVTAPNAEFTTYIPAEFGQTIDDAKRKLKIDKEIEFRPPEQGEARGPRGAAAPREDEDEEVPERALRKCPEVPAVCWRGAAAEFRDLIGPSIESSDSFLLAGFLTIWGAILSKSVCFRIPGRRLYPNCYTILVGPSAYAHKGTAMACVRGLLEMIGPKNVYTLDTVDSFEGTVDELANRMEADTPRGTGPPSALMLIDEFNSLLIKAAAKHNKLLPELKKWYESPDEPPAVYSRAGAVRLRGSPMFSLLASSEMDDLVDMGDRNIRGGIGNRIIYVAGEKKPPLQRWVTPNERALQRLAARLKKLAEKWWAEAEKTKEKTVALRMNAEADREWWLWYRRYAQRGADDATVAKLSVRDRPHLLKAATQYATLDDATLDGPHEILPEHLRAAVSWTEHLLEQRYWIFRTAGVPEKARQSIEMVDYVRSKNGAVLMREFIGRFTRMDPRDREDRLKYLTATQWHPERPLCVEPRPTGKRGRKQMWVALNTERIRQHLMAMREIGQRGG